MCLCWEEISNLLKRSYSYKLIEDFIESFDQEVEDKIDFFKLSKRQESFDHIVEVFKQDLKIGEKTKLVDKCDNREEEIISNSIIKVLKDNKPDSELEHLLKKNLVVKNISLNNKLSEKWIKKEKKRKN